MPQIEVTFDIDANGIVNVSAKDNASGKTQQIRITANSGLSDEEIKRMVKDAELNAAEDKKRSDLIGAKNQLDALIYQTEKSLKEFADKVEASTKSEVESAVSGAKADLESQDLEKLQAATEKLNQANAKLAEFVYKQSAAQQQSTQGGGAETGGGPGASQQAKSNNNDDVVDADFKEV
jgi:molecular chaperone DnaK